MTPIELQHLADTQPQQLARAFRATLVDFGYAVDQATVERYILNWKRGQAPKGGPEMFVHRWLNEGID